MIRLPLFKGETVTCVSLVGARVESQLTVSLGYVSQSEMVDDF